MNWWIKYSFKKLEEGYTGHFVVQRHDAKRAGKHWDFRLELPAKLIGNLEEYREKRKTLTPEPKGKESKTILWSGVLRKGIPSKGERHLFVETEPHPIEYLEFEGEIPEGYGAGSVKIEDTGIFKVLDYEPNKFTIELIGKKYAGIFTFIKMKEKQWLVIKKINS